MAGNFERCKRCGEYGWSPCRCTIIGKVWVPEWQETRDDGRDIWSFHSADLAINDWAKNRLYEDFEAFRPDEAVIVAFLPAGERKAQYFRVLFEYRPEFSSEAAEDDDIEEARKTEAETRKREREYRKRKAVA